MTDGMAEMMEQAKEQKDQQRAETVDREETEASAPETESDFKDLYLRTLAEFDNYRKRTERERSASRLYAKRELLLDVLDVLDNFERAVESAAELESERGSWAAGVVAIYRQFLRMIEAHGVATFDVVGEPFDPSLHEAVGSVRSETVPEEHIVYEVRKGYLLNGELLRPARVVVSSGVE